MAPRKRNAKRAKRNYKKRSFKKKSKTFATQSLVSYRMRSQMPFPQRYRSSFTVGVYGSIPIAATTGHYFASLNSVLTPLDGGAWPSPSIFLSSLNPTGLTPLLNTNFYQQFRVYGSRLTIEFLPQALADTVLVTVTPSDSSAVPTNVANAQNQPYTKTLFMSSSKMNSKSGSFISNSMTQHKFLGVTSGAIKNDLSGAYVGAWNADPIKQLYWVVNWLTPDGVGLVTAIEYRIKVTYLTELFDPTSATMV